MKIESSNRSNTISEVIHEETELRSVAHGRKISKRNSSQFAPSRNNSRQEESFQKNEVEKASLKFHNTNSMLFQKKIMS